ncbi:MAG TPA: hypothetical protein PLU16_03395 [Gallionellaceae bacterium]|jgi:hypothetical protein|nr:MAG: hypothetical protein B7Y04_11970 [Gallionellales bacterium 24-53-125]HQS57777.1 hypothetical protein [Gallionellaceae bacterium]HQS74230.1 hypothetical protein [Gallionellaceae bacterium]
MHLRQIVISSVLNHFLPSWRLYVATSQALLAIALFLPAPVYAEENTMPNTASSVPATTSATVVEPGPEPEPEPEEDTAIAVDPTRDYLSGKLESWAKGLDNFFGDYRNYQESNNSVIQFNVTQVTGYQGEPRYDYDLNVKISLPNTEKKMQLLIETNPEEKSTSYQTQINSRLIKPVTSPAKLAAALRYEKREAERWRFTTDGGIQLAGLASTPFVRARLSLAMPLEDWRLNVAESVFWFSTIGAGESTLIDFERPLTKQHLFRASSNATWLNSTQYFDLSQSFSVYHTFDERTALLYQVSAIGVSRPQMQVSDYVILMTYRYRWHREWVYVEISPQLHFPQEENYKTSKLLSVRLEILFDQSR